MQKLYVCYIILLVFMISGSCNVSKQIGKIYITEKTIDNLKLITVKFLKQNCNESTGKNVFLNYSNKISYGGYSWYVYDIKNGSWDIYLEYYDKKGDYHNAREEVYIQGESQCNEWAAIWFVDDTIYQIRTKQGSGELNLTGSKFNRTYF